jgi:Domain of Unknown Function (DUF1080)
MGASAVSEASPILPDGSGKTFYNRLMHVFSRSIFVAACIAVIAPGCKTAQRPPEQAGTASNKSTLLFPKDGVPEGWRVGEWNDVSKPPANGGKWMVTNGVLRGSTPRGTWLMSEKEYGDFILDYDFQLGARGNSGCALRAPMFGDPAFDGMELQMADYRYNPSAKDSELTGGLYRALAPTKQVYKPEQWNTYHIELRGSHVKVVLNNELIQDVDLNTQTNGVKRHDDSPAVPLRDRPRRGHIGFQELSRASVEGKESDADRVKIRNARITELP